MNKFELPDKEFHDYNDGKIVKDIPTRMNHISLNPNFDWRGEKELLSYLSHYLIQKDFTHKPQLSLFFKIWRFLRYLKWSNKHYTSGGGKIPDYRFYRREINYHLSRLTSLTYLSSRELRQLLSAGLRYYAKNGWDEGPPLSIFDLSRCKNLQEFYSVENEIDFEFAKGIKNMRVVDLGSKDSENINGIFNGIDKYGSRVKLKRKVHSLEFLESCLVLNLQDCYIENFDSINENVLTLNLKNSNFQDLSTLKKLKKLQFLDISDTSVSSLNGIESFKDLKVLNCSNIEFSGTEKSKYEFLNQLYWYSNLELLIMDAKLYDEYKKAVNILSNEKILVVDTPYKWNVTLSTFDVIKFFKIQEQIKNRDLLSEIDFGSIRDIIVKEISR